MFSGKHTFENLSTIIDSVHDLFERWLEDQSHPPGFDEDMMYRAKLAIHEWLANLIQHANFDGKPPRVTLEFMPNGQSVKCVIEDNSSGFDLDGTLTTRQDLLDAFPDRGMGLLMLKACTENLTYTPVDGLGHRLEFVISINQDPWFNIPFN